MRAIPLPCGKETKIDAADFYRLGGLSWRSQRANQRAERYYVYAHAAGRKIYLHRAIMNASAGVTVDHRDGDGLNNCRENLRIATRAQNNANRASTSSTGYRGVWRTRCGMFQASISERSGSNKCAYLGTFSTADAAARAYDAAAVERFGDFARLNFPAEQGDR